MEFLVQCLELSWALNDCEGELGERTHCELLIWCVASWYMKLSEIPALAAAQEWGWCDPQTAFTNKWLYVGCVHRRVSELNNFTIQRNGSGSSSYWWLSRSMPQYFFLWSNSGGVCDGFMSLTATAAVGCVQTLGAGSWLVHVHSGQWVSLRPPSGTCVLTFGLASPPLSDFWDFWLVIFRYQHL